MDGVDAVARVTEGAAIERVGGCCCGTVRYVVVGDPQRVTRCHCRHCRRTSGAPFVTWAQFDKATYRVTAGEAAIHEYESRSRVTRTFCFKCGTLLTYRNSDESEILDNTAISLDANDDLEVEDHVWCARMVPWLTMNDRLLRYSRGRDDAA